MTPKNVGKGEKDIVAFIIGLIAYTILKFIPVFSFIVVFLAVTLGLGAFISAISPAKQVKKEISRKK